MSNGHYTALVDANAILRSALEYIANASWSKVPSINLYVVAHDVACDALRRADEISNRNGITQPNNEQENSNVR